MKKAAKEALERYGDLIGLQHPVSKTHPTLSAGQRAAQFSPFAALTGYEESVEETAKEETDRMNLRPYTGTIDDYDPNDSSLS